MRRITAASARLSERRRAARGFTLVELLVVIAVISILAAMLMPALEDAVASARAVSCASNQRQIGLCILNYAQDHGDTLAPFTHGTDELTAPAQSRWFSRNGDRRNLGIVHDAGYVAAAAVLFCPSQRWPGFTWESHRPWPSLTGYDGTASGLQGIRLPYNYNPWVRDPAGNYERTYSRLSAVPSSKMLLFDTMEMLDAVAHDHAPGWNVLDADGSVRFAVSPAVYGLVGQVYSDWTWPEHDDAQRVLDE